MKDANIFHFLGGLLLQKSPKVLLCVSFEGAGCGVGEDSRESLGLQGDSTSPS